jgi:hypothetical protein
VDEAQHIVELTNDDSVIRQLNCIKSLADRSQVTHVFLGTYSLGNALHLNGQLVKRCRIIEFRAYDPTDERDKVSFSIALEKFQDQLPINATFQLKEHLDFCMQRSAGCVGIMRDWLVKATQLALEFGSETLSIKHLEAEAFSKAQVKILYDEISEGRKNIAELLDEEEHRQLILRELETERKNREEAAKKKRRIPKPGQRKPVRDAVGVTQEYPLEINVDSGQTETLENSI